MQMAATGGKHSDVEKDGCCVPKLESSTLLMATVEDFWYDSGYVQQQNVKSAKASISLPKLGLETRRFTSSDLRATARQYPRPSTSAVFNKRMQLQNRITATWRHECLCAGSDHWDSSRPLRWTFRSGQYPGVCTGKKASVHGLRICSVSSCQILRNLPWWGCPTLRCSQVRSACTSAQAASLASRVSGQPHAANLSDATSLPWDRIKELRLPRSNSAKDTALKSRRAAFFSDVFRFAECQATEFEPPKEPRSLTFANHVGELLQSRPHVGDMDNRKVSRDSCATSSSFQDKFRKVLFPQTG